MTEVFGTPTFAPWCGPAGSPACPVPGLDGSLAKAQGGRWLLVTAPETHTPAPVCQWVYTWLLLPRPHFCVLGLTAFECTAPTHRRPQLSPGAVLPLLSVSNQLALTLGFIREQRKLGFTLEFIKAEWSWACCAPAEGLGSLPPPCGPPRPAPAGCLWAPSQEALRRKLGG